MNSKSRPYRLLSFFMSILFLLESAPLYAASMTDYCIIPPYVKRDVKPNILILMDNADSMGDQAYTDSYDSLKTYNGYFNPQLNYYYPSNRWYPYSTGAVSGNILNWVTTSKYDLLQSILVGGKSVNRVSDPKTLKSEGNSWEKTYNNCIFQVNSGNLTITESSNGACSLLNYSPNMASYDNPYSESILLSDLSESGNNKTTAQRIFNSIVKFIVPEAYAAKPLRVTTNSLPDAQQGVAYSATVSAEGGSESGYSWSATGLPSGLSITASGTLSTSITGTTSAATGRYNVTITVTDSSGNTDNRTIHLDVTASSVRSSNFNIWVCRGDYTNNCSSGTIPDKEGIIDMFWDQARFGIIDFNQQGGNLLPNSPSGQSCIPSTSKSSFSTSIENATPVGDASTYTPLINGMYSAVDYYKNETASNCNPFEGTQQCLKNFTLMITGGSGADNPPNPNAGTPNVFSDPTNCGSLTYNLSKNSCYGYANDLRSSYAGKQNVSTYIVNTMGTNGSILTEAANSAGGLYYNVTDPSQLRDQLILAMQDMIKRAASGTAASVLASGEGSGANLIQAVFYPRRKFFNSTTGTYDEIAWTGRLSNFWYYVDPLFTNSGIYEDNASSTVLNPTNDYLVGFYFDSSTEKTLVTRYSDGNGDGIADTAITPDIEFEKLNSLWEAGLALWSRDVTSASTKRKIYSTVNGSSLLSGNFSSDANNGDSDNSAALLSYFDLPATDSDANGYADGDLNRDGSVNSSDASILIRYVHGEDFTSYGLRSRTVPVDLNNDGDTLDSGESSKVWKLGDIVHSTPRVSSWIQLNTYDSVYGDTTYGNANTDPKSGFIYSSSYTSRGMVFAGGNDGMLHAFKLGDLGLPNSSHTAGCTFGANDKACLSGSDLGKEIWAFIPKNTLPYLKYMTDSGYCHIYSVDLSPYIFDASIGVPGSGDVSGDTKTVNHWRTILIGGMRYGGACRNAGDSCTDCVKTPVSGNGYSSYFALDVTDQNNPTLLWEFSNSALGFTTTAPAIIRIGSDKNMNGKWFAVLGSGPTGPINTTDNQFLGRSDQNLRLFILDLKTGSLLRTIDTGVTYAFAGSMLNASHDTDLDYQDDALYIPYVKKTGTTWTEGGVGRLFTKEAESVSNWVWSKVIDNVGPVTSAVVRLQSNKKGTLWLYFGSGRYYYETSSEVDDLSGQRRLYGVKDPCFSSTGLDKDCTTTISASLTDVTSNASANPDDITVGWKIDLDAAVSGSFGAERVITDPLSSTSGVVYYTTYKPYDDVCTLGGNSFIWALKYDTGGSAGALLKGKAIVQVSTGSIEQKDLSTAFTEKSGRRTSAMQGVPPSAQGLSLLASPPPVKRIIHMRER